VPELDRQIEAYQREEPELLKLYAGKTVGYCYDLITERHRFAANIRIARASWFLRFFCYLQ
jgi:hypothetical protein